MSEEMTQKEKDKEVAKLFEHLKSRKSVFDAILPKKVGVESEILIRTTIARLRDSKDLFKKGPLDKDSVYFAVANMATMGLIPDLGLCYLLRYGNKLYAHPGARGLITIAMRSGMLTDIETKVVYECDDYQEEYGYKKDMPVHNRCLTHVSISSNPV